MPSGAKKRKAAKRKKEHEEQLRTGVVSPTTGLPHNLPGNGEMEEEEEDLASQEGKGSESSSELPSPIARDAVDGHRRHLAGETEELVKSSGEETIEEKESAVNGEKERTGESSSPQNAVDESADQPGEEIPLAAVEVKIDDTPPASPPSGRISLKSTGIRVSNLEPVNVEHKPQKESPSESIPIQCKQSEQVDAGDPVEQPAPFSEGVVQAGSAPVERLKVEESAAEEAPPPSHKHEEEMPLSSAAVEEPGFSVESHPRECSPETGRTTEAGQTTQLERRTSWMSCCGLFDAVTRGNRETSA